MTLEEALARISRLEAELTEVRGEAATRRVKTKELETQLDTLKAERDAAVADKDKEVKRAQKLEAGLGEYKLQEKRADAIKAAVVAAKATNAKLNVDEAKLSQYVSTVAKTPEALDAAIKDGLALFASEAPAASTGVGSSPAGGDATTKQTASGAPIVEGKPDPIGGLFANR